MPFVRAQRSLNGCSCERRGIAARAMSGLGDAAVTGPSADQVRQLQAQINRYGANAPVGLQIAIPSLSITGVLDAPTVTYAMAILESRLALSWLTLPSAATANASALANLYGQDPTTYILANFDTVLSTIQLLADSLKLAPATPIVISQAVDALGGPTAALVAIGGAAFLFYYLGGGK